MVGTPPREPPRCERREAFRKGKSIGMGLFVIKGKRIEAGEEVCEITGRVIIGVKAWLAWKQKHPRNNKSIEFGNRRDPYVVVGRETDFWSTANHDCDQQTTGAGNMYVVVNGKKAFLIASKDVESDQELLWDYGYLWSVEDEGDTSMDWMKFWYCEKCGGDDCVPVPKPLIAVAVAVPMPKVNVAFVIP